MTPYFYGLLTALCLISMVVAAEMAKRRGLNPRLWFLAAALVGPLVLPLLFFRKRIA